jgi:hypothetical protein
MKFMKELAVRIIGNKESPSKILGEVVDPGVRGHIGEATLRLLTIHGIHPTDASSSVIPYISDTNMRRMISVGDIYERIDIINNGLINSGGADKIDVKWREGTQLAVCSSKIGMKNIKSIADLQVSQMLTEITESGGYTENGVSVCRSSIKPYVLVYKRNMVELIK